MRKIAATYLLLLFSFSAMAQNKTLSDASYLNKLSLSLRGYAPSMEEYANLQRASGNSSEFFREVIRQYQSSREYQERMVIRVDNLLFLKSPSTNYGLQPSDSKPGNRADADYLQFSAAQNITRNITARNLSWDTLLTGKSYKAAVYEEDGNYSEQAFYDGPAGKTTPVTYSFQDDSSPNTLKPTFVDFNFSKDDNRLAGIITTQRFFRRYTTTTLNKNRRRAAAVYRIFLCDPMAAAIPEVHDTSKLADLIFPANGQVTEDQVHEALDNKHGTQEDCMKCHYKLDPLGATFRASPLVLHERPSSGALIYKRSNGELVNKPAQGIGEIAKLITQQPEYTECQVGYFWNWFIGSDIPRTAAVTQELVSQFNGMGRKTNDFISYIVSRPEFRQRKVSTPENTLTSSVRTFLQRCDSCHVNQASSLPSFAKWPIGGEKSAKWLRRISDALDLEHGGDDRTMPPEDGFRPSKHDLKLLKQWIDSGAPNEQGQNMVAP
jgi:hypothetical protein